MRQSGQEFLEHIISLSERNLWWTNWVLPLSGSFHGQILQTELLEDQILKNNLSQFTHLMKCEPTDYILRIISEHLSDLNAELNDKFADLKGLNFPSWITQPFLFNSENNECLAMCSDQIDELMDLQNRLDSVKPIHASKQQLMSLNPQVSTKYPKLAYEAQQVLWPFPTTYLVECAFSAVTDILTKKRGRINNCERGDLRAKLTCFVPRFSHLISEHQAQGSIWNCTSKIVHNLGYC